MQVFAPYGSPYTLPFPVSARPSAVTTAPNVSYPQVGTGGVMALADQTTFFGLRFTGACLTLTHGRFRVPYAVSDADKLASRAAQRQMLHVVGEYDCCTSLRKQTASRCMWAP